MVRGSGAHYLRQTLWKCEDAGSFATIFIESASPCTNNMANDTAIDDDEHQEATCQEGTLSGPQDVIPTKKRPRSSTPDTGDLRPVVLQEVLADQMQMPLPTADRKFKFIEGDWFVRMPVSYSTSMHKKVWFFYCQGWNYYFGCARSCSLVLCVRLSAPLWPSVFMCLSQACSCIFNASWPRAGLIFSQ